LIIGGGVAGYVAAIKAGQEGMKVLATASEVRELMLMDLEGDVYRKTRNIRRYMLERRLHSL
jgi:thioredoxin reductase